MAVISRMPAQAIIDGFRGTLDYYKFCGLNVVRAWPRKPPLPRAPAVEAQWQPFAYINTAVLNLPPNIIEAYKRMALGSSLTWRDLAVRLYFNRERI